jgi:hypothetical protein
MGDEVRTEENFFRRTITINSFTGRSLSARLQGSIRFFSVPLSASPSIRLAASLPRRGAIRTYPVQLRGHNDRLGLPYTPTA